MNPTSNDPTTPNAEIDGRYELQQMSRELPADAIDTLPSNISSAVIDEPSILRKSRDDSSPKSQEPSETSLEALERTYRTPKRQPKTSLEVLECAHHVSQISAKSLVLVRNNDSPLRKPSSAISLEEQSNVPLPLSSDNVASAHPSLISLPPSSLGPSDSKESQQSVFSSSEPHILYKENNLRLSRYFHHLEFVNSSSRHDKANITIFDYTGNVLRGHKHLSDDFMSAGSAESQEYTRSKIDECRHFICSINSCPQVETRLVVVEDLGPSIINLLGATFDLSPEFFEEHLQQSRYRGLRAYGPSSSTWRTSNLQKDYLSFTWARPGESWALGIEPGEWEDLLDPDTAHLTVVEQIKSNDGISSNVVYEYIPKTNVFRPETDMSTNPAGRIPETIPCGWQERATMCKVNLNGLQYVIVVLDPVPLLEKTTRGIRDAMKPFRLRGKHEVYESSNIECRSERIKTSEDVFAQTEILSLFTQRHCRTPWNLDYHSLFRQSTAESAVPEIMDQLSPFQSTVQAFEKWLVSAAADEVGKYNNRLGPGSMIFRIAHQDTIDLLQLMRSAVAEINLASSDSELQDSALHWRRRLDVFRTLLIQLEASLHSFVDFLHADASALSKGPPPKLDTDPIGYLLHDAISEIEAHKQRITQAYSSLTSKVQISDSHRSIAEAETVTRLTELAFLFIPLSFATSIFGMQFINGSTPATTYIAVAVALTSAAYLLRFIIDRTTEQRSDFRRSIRNRITAYAKLRTESRIPTATFLRWLSHVLKQYILRFWKLSFLVASILIMLVIPLPIIWTSSLSTGLQIAISCLLIAVPWFFVVSYFWTKYLTRQRLRQLDE